MVFQGEDKPLDQDVIKRVQKFILTGFEWLSFHGTLIVKHGGCTQAGRLIYEVPINKLFFLVGCSLSMSNISTNSDYESKLSIDQQQFSFANSTPVLNVYATALGTDPNANEGTQATYSIPLRFEAGWKFFAYDNPSTQGNSDAFIQGYEIDKNLFDPGF